MMEGDTGEHWTSTVSALFIRVCKQGRITLPRWRLCCTVTNPTVTFFFFKPSTPDGTFPDSFGSYLTCTSGRDPM